MKPHTYTAASVAALLIAFTMPSYADSWVKCANENKHCNFSGKMKVRYGHGGKWHYKTFTNGVACKNSVFGDPAPWTFKRCEYLKKSKTYWKYCAKEGTKCKFSGTKKVRYGVHGNYKYKTLEGGAYCTNDGFNGDPMPLVKKHCYTQEER